MLDLNSTKIAEEKGRVAGYWNVYFLGISLIFASLLISWPAGLFIGFWPYFLSTCIISLAYIFLMLSLAEMTSILPFSGGAYGFVRVTTWPYLGYLVGCAESFANIYYVAIAIVAIGEAVTFTFNGDAKWEPMYWLIIYALSLALLIFGDRSFFTLTTALGILSMVLVVLYLLSSSSTMNFERQVIQEESSPRVYVDLKSFVQLLPISSWFYVGIDTLPLACGDTKKAKSTVPYAMARCTYTTVLFSLAILVGTCSQAPGMGALFDYESLPLNMGYAHTFRISDRLASLLSLPGLFISNYAFMYAYAKQLYALSRSQLMPASFAYTYGAIKMPYVALLTGALLGYVSMLLCWYFSRNLLATMNAIYNSCQMGSFMIYCASLSSFIIFRVKYHTLERKFVNRGGVISAVLTMAVFAVAFYGVAFLQEDGYVSVITFAAFVAGTTAFYFGYARYHQCYSPEESSIMFIIYVIKANLLRKKAIASRILTYIRSKLGAKPPLKPGKMEKGKSRNKGSVMMSSARSKESGLSAPDRATAKSKINVSRDDAELIDHPHHITSETVVLFTCDEGEEEREEEEEEREEQELDTVPETVNVSKPLHELSFRLIDMIRSNKIAPDRVRADDHLLDVSGEDQSDGDL